MILVTGGARSGKSRHAESLISHSLRVRYIATSQIFDAEMAERIQHHRDSRPAHWQTEERWQNLADIITPQNDPHEAILLECITTLITNILFASGNEEEIERWDFTALENQVRSNHARLRLFAGLVAMFLIGGIAGAAGFKHVGFVFVVPLALVLLALSLPPLWADRARLRHPLRKAAPAQLPPAP